MHPTAQKLLGDALAYIRFVQGHAPAVHVAADNNTNVAKKLETFLIGADSK